MPEYADVPPTILAAVRRISLALPETYEEQAWVGTRWRIRKRTFSHVLTAERERSAAFVRAAPSGTGPVTVLVFRAAGAELDALVNAGPPFYQPGWSPTVVGMVLTGRSDWTEVAELLTDSYRLMAPKKLARSLD